MYKYVHTYVCMNIYIYHIYVHMYIVYDSVSIYCIHIIHIAGMIATSNGLAALTGACTTLTRREESSLLRSFVDQRSAALFIPSGKQPHHDLANHLV